MRWFSALSVVMMVSVGCSDAKDEMGTDDVSDDTASVSDDTGGPGPDADSDADSDDTGNSDVDEDGDGFDASVDCDDQDASINPDAEEACDGLDNNCDGEVDEGFPSAAEYFPDADGDGYGDDAEMVVSCEPVDGLITQGGDCDLSLIHI